MIESPVFIPIKTKFFRAFESGEKSIEYRLAGPRWNERVCSPGRRVTLSHGYSGARLYARIRRTFRVRAREIADAMLIYPEDAELIAIELHSISAS